MLLYYFDFLAHSEVLPTAFHVIANFSANELKEANLNKPLGSHGECEEKWEEEQGAT